MSFLAELKRRNVIRVGVAYMVAAWLLLQIVDVLVPILDLPGWVGKLMFLILVIGVIPVLIFSWAYEMTPDGIKPESEVDHDQSITLQTARKLDRVTIILVLIVAGIVVIDRFIPESGELSVDSQVVEVHQPESNVPIADEPTIPLDGRQSIAVIPFINMSDDETNEYFSDGISEELLNVLVRIKSLRVPSRTSSFTFKGSDKNLVEIGQALNVDHILEGSVRKADNRIRVTAQLIEVASDTHLWSETYTRELDDIFAVQDEIAQAIVAALKINLTVADNQILNTHSTTNVEAYNKYLLGRHLWNQRSQESLLASAKTLREAVEIDPEYDEAWVALADTYSAIPDWGAGSADEFIPLADEAIARALAINPHSARALANSAYIKAVYDFDWEGANIDFELALKLEPGYASARQWYGHVLNLQGRLEEALAQVRQARVLDPMSASIRNSPSYMLMWANRLEEAEVYFLDTLALGGQPLRWTIFNLDMLNTLRGDYSEARRRAIQLAEMEGYDPAADLARIDAVENPQLKDRALMLLEQRQDITDAVFGKALQYALLGEYDLALESLETAFTTGDRYIVDIGYMRIYDPLRGNPRFQAMLKEMNLSP